VEPVEATLGQPVGTLAHEPFCSVPCELLEAVRECADVAARTAQTGAAPGLGQRLVGLCARKGGWALVDRTHEALYADHVVGR